jgi:hypothetical protein
MKFKKAGYKTISKELVNKKVRGYSLASLAECCIYAAVKSIKNNKPWFIISNATGYHVLDELTLRDKLNGYFEVFGYIVTKYEVVYG